MKGFTQSLRGRPCPGESFLRRAAVSLACGLGGALLQTGSAWAFSGRDGSGLTFVVFFLLALLVLAVLVPLLSGVLLARALLSPGRRWGPTLLGLGLSMGVEWLVLERIVLPHGGAMGLGNCFVAMLLPGCAAAVLPVIVVSRRSHGRSSGPASDTDPRR